MKVRAEIAPADLPEGWPMRRVRDVATLINGFPFKSEDFDSSGEVPLVRIRDLTASDFELYVPKSAVPDESLMKNGDLAIGMDGDFNSVLWARGPAALNQRVCILRPRRGTDIRFLGYVLPSVLQIINDLTYSTTVKHLSGSDVLQQLLPFPDVKLQQRICQYLDRETAKIDDLICKQERLIELLAEKRQAIITHAVTKGLDPTVPTKSSGVPWQGPVPEHWTVQPLKNLIRMQTGVTLGKDFSEVETETYPYLRVANVQIGYVDLNEVKEIDLPKDLAATSMLRAGDVLMTEGGDRDKLARGCIWEAQIAPCVHQNHIFAVRTGDQLFNKFLVLALDADPARAYFYFTGKQSTNLASTNSTTVKNFRFGVPPVVEQHRIVDHLGRKTRLIDDLVDKANAVISTLKERRSALISAAVTGRIDVREGVAKL
ncbi:restriction endonuclease subunit S [Arthrobacter sp. FX8]|uniref:restriction endonuclease subunit S n=1 Tax=Arthrobacter sp. FX8 TaxID=2997335 RepID=UPI003FA3BC50